MAVFLGIGHGVIECIGEEASHRFEGEDGVKSSVDDAAMARDGYLWVTTTDSGLFFRSVRPFRDFLDGGKLEGRLFL